MGEGLEGALQRRGVRYRGSGVFIILDGNGDPTARVHSDSRQFTIEIGPWHEHGPDDEDTREGIARLMAEWVSGRARIVTITRLGVPVAWRMDSLSPDGEWWGLSETGLLIPPFWPRRERITMCPATYEADVGAAPDAE